MFRSPLGILTLGIAAFLVACNHDTTFHVKNTGADAIQIETYRNGDISNNLTPTTRLGPGESADLLVRAFPAGRYSVVAYIPDSAKADESDGIISDNGHESGPRSISVSLSSSGIGHLDINSAQRTLQNDFSKLGPGLGFAPKPLNNAAQTIVGAIVVAEPASAGTPNGAWYRTVPPGAVGSQLTQTEIQNFPYDSNTQSHEVTITSTAGSNLSVPLIGAAVNFSSGDVIKTAYHLTDIGMVQKPEIGGFDPAIAVNKLDPQIRDSICNTLRSHSQAKLFYINQVYALRSAVFDSEAGKKLAFKAGATATAVVTGDAAYSFENSTKDHQEFHEVVVNVGGDEMTVACNAAAENGGTHGFKALRLTLAPGSRRRVIVIKKKSRAVAIPLAVIRTFSTIK